MAMTDRLAIGDADQMMQLAVNESNSKQIETADKMRKTRFAPVARQKGNRWGSAEDKPYKPLPYIDMPIGLSDKEVDQFLREQRLEELTDKIRRNILEDVEPDIRPPSPPPVYDRMGNRINTRDVRIRKNMLNEQNRLVRYMQKNVPGYVPPPDFRPQKLAKKLIIPVEKYPNAPFVPVILGARGANHKKLQEITGCKIMIRGRGMEEKYQSEEDSGLPLHVHIEADHEEQIECADKLIVPLLNPDTEDFARAQQIGLESLAKVNGFTVALHERKCGICGATGHTGFECPENEGGTGWKMANVVCAICGDRGHVTSDCPQAARDRVETNVNWKAEAAKKMEADRLYKEMMSDFGEDLTCKPVPGQEKSMGPRPGLGSEAYGATGGNPGPRNPNLREMEDASGVEDYVVDIGTRIPEDICGFFVGAKGVNILRLKAEAQCEISLEQRFVNPDGTKNIRITGHLEQRERAKQLVMQEIEKARQKRQHADAQKGARKGPYTDAVNAAMKGQSYGGAGGQNYGGGYKGNKGGAGAGGYGGYGGMAYGAQFGAGAFPGGNMQWGMQGYGAGMQQGGFPPYAMNQAAMMQQGFGGGQF
ncbi:unnamed protein product [Amoebophrya sp. A25]|nr:unnamed protein product [Amoebophrya sp. A25]|eukprot:GSA25T00002046001.1